MLQISCLRIYHRGFDIVNIGSIREISVNIGNISIASKNTKKIHFFQIFKYLKQQQHQINTFSHKYEKKLIYKMRNMSNDQHIKNESCPES